MRGLGAECQVLAAYLVTGPHANMIGLYYLPLAYVTQDTGLSAKAVTKALGELARIGFCVYDQETEMVWVYEMISHQLGDGKISDSQRAGVVNLYESVPECAHLEAFYDRHKDDFPFQGPRRSTRQKVIPTAPTPMAYPTDTLSIAYGGGPLQEQLQEQEQIQEQEQEAPSAKSAALVVVASPAMHLDLADGSKHAITDAEVRAWEQAYPGVNVLQALRNMQQWLIANPKKRKTKAGIRAFCVNWLNRDQDSGRHRSQDSPAIPRLVSRQDQSFAEAIAGVEAFNASRK